MGCVFELTLSQTAIPQTRLWITEEVQKMMEDHAEGSFLKKLAKMTVSGFEFFERGDWPQVRHETEGVYRIGIRDSLFRMIGFYEDGSKSNFICLDAFKKRGQKLGRNEWVRILKVAHIKKNNLWSRCSNDFPRLAQET